MSAALVAVVMVGVAGKSVRAAIKFSVRQIATGRLRRPRDWHRGLLELTLKLRQHRVPLLVSALFVGLGFAYYAMVEPDTSLRNLIMVSLSVRTPQTTSDISGLYQLALPIFLEVIFFGFILTALVDRYDPVAMGRVLASRLQNHTVIVGYTHLGERIANHLHEHGRPFCVIEPNKDRIDELLARDDPVIVGDPLEIRTLEDAGVARCKEVFILVDNLQHAFVLSFHLRGLCAQCKVYIEISDHEEFRDYFVTEPFRAYTFSISRFAVESLREWTSLSDPPSGHPTPSNSASDGDMGSTARLSSGSPILGDTVDEKEGVPLPGITVPTPFNNRVPVKTDPPSVNVLIIGSDSCARAFVKFMLLERLTWNTIVVDEGMSEHFLADTVDSNVRELKPQNPQHPLERLSKELAPYLLMGRRKSYTRVSRSMTDSFLHIAHNVGHSSSNDDIPLRSQSERKRRFDVNAHLTLINSYTKRLRNIAEHVDFLLISYLFITWPEEDRVSDAIYLCMAVQRQYPHIRLFVRTFDDHLREVLESFGATVFSTSSYAFNMLQREVPSDSNLSL